MLPNNPRQRMRGMGKKKMFIACNGSAHFINTPTVMHNYNHYRKESSQWITASTHAAPKESWSIECLGSAKGTIKRGKRAHPFAQLFGWPLLLFSAYSRFFYVVNSVSYNSNVLSDSLKRSGLSFGYSVVFGLEVVVSKLKNKRALFIGHSKFPFSVFVRNRTVAGCPLCGKSEYKQTELHPAKILARKENSVSRRAIPVSTTVGNDKRRAREWIPED